jgi:hypothetical protein
MRTRGLERKGDVMQHLLRDAKASVYPANLLLEPVAELTIASTKNPLGFMASLGDSKGFMASREVVWKVLNDVTAIAA